MDFEKIIIDDSDNGLYLAPGDMDGFQIVETVNDKHVYVYFSESERLIQGIHKIRKLYGMVVKNE